MDDLTEYQKLLLSRYLHEDITEYERGLLIALGLGPKEFGYEPEMLEWLKAHPNASLKETFDHDSELAPELVVEGDDDEDTEDG